MEIADDDSPSSRNWLPVDALANTRPDRSLLRIYLTSGPDAVENVVTPGSEINASLAARRVPSQASESHP